MVKITSSLKKSQQEKSKNKENLNNISTEPEFLEDINPNSKKKQPWKEKKQESLLLYESLTRLTQKDLSYKKRAAQVNSCGSSLVFKYWKELNMKKLHHLIIE